jgi:CHAD domain-containing protein
MPHQPDPSVPAGLADSSETAFAAAAVLERLKMLTKEAEGVKDGSDIEFVHRMRVASRRLRTALRVFADCLPRRPHKVWTRLVRQVTRSLSRARDLDVQLDFIAGMDTRRLKPGFRPGVQRLRLRLKQQRAALQDEVVRRVENFESSGVVESMQDRLEPLATEVPAGNALWRRARREITTHLDELLVFVPFVDRPECQRELHQMRIATKHLRYSFELFRPLFGDQLEKAIDMTKEIQELLGDIHDYDVWAELLPEFARSERTRTLEYYGSDAAFPRLAPGLEYLRRRVAALRRASYREFARYWHQTESDLVWEHLRQTVAAGGVG